MLFSGTAGTFLLGFASGFFTREIVEVSKKNLGPMMGKAGKSSSQWFEKGKESLAHLQESFEDLVAEFRTAPLSDVKVKGAHLKKKKAGSATKTKAKTKAKAKAKPNEVYSRDQQAAEGAL